MPIPALHIDWLTRSLTAPKDLRRVANEVRTDKGLARHHAANALEAAAIRIDASEQLIAHLTARLTELEGTR
ncbi:hypothetical protein [Curtobacterium sp. MCSS17_016]|uniref:hypothetical protein n=1 Tax=Curtobacterium sp. MCSS17_016 TaxID=2175644 RepID=UPI000DA8FC23|nr:hypothetical protein [Curtobacterium sp. MCSS17_016]WIE81265.1 hypothetical protein DEJ19_018705 [Curtobacterium sp. MCSS17_016]